MYKNIEFENIIENGIDNYLLIDVRSPKEYQEATIPGSINLPLFTDEERELIGTVYHHESIEQAKTLGVEAVSKKLPNIYKVLNELQLEHRKKPLVMFCARGGMRSSTIVSLFASLGANVLKLKGGYKSYRRYIAEQLPLVNTTANYVVLHGNTGVGKTHILTGLRSHGFDVLDLEACANNRGSLLGAVGLGSPRSQKQFESLLFNELKYRQSDYIFVEAESKKIGNVTIPDFIFTSMQNGTHINLTADYEFRADLLIEEYTKKSNCDEEIIVALDNLKKYIGEKNKERFNDMIIDKNYRELAIELMKKYYDPMYENASNKYSFSFELKVVDLDQSTLAIKEWWKSSYPMNCNLASTIY